MTEHEKDFFLGTWTKDDGLKFSITKENIHFELSRTNRFHFPRVNAISFSWNDLDRSWGEVVFKRVDDNTIVETHGEIPGAHFRRTPPHPPRILYRELTFEQRDSFHANGFLVLKRAVDKEFVKQARKAILADLETSGIPPEAIGQYRAQTWTPNLRADDIRSQILIDVFRHSALVPAVSSLVSDPSPYLGTPQVALIFPKLYGQRELGAGAHIDGIPTPTNGLQYGKIHGFTSLIGVALSDQREDFCGNLVVYPGSHRTVNESLCAQWRDHQSLGPGIGNWKERDVFPSDVQLPVPLMIKLEPGDAIICHYLLIHEVAPNYEDEIRMQLYLRVKSSHFDESESLFDLRRDYR